jgi:hypothetical protein
MHKVQNGVNKHNAITSLLQKAVGERYRETYLEPDMVDCYG